MQKKKAPPVVADINVTPMVDVMLVLLIIFMVITPLLTKGVDVEKYRSKNAIAMKAADKEDAILVAITRDGKVFLSPGNKQTLSEDLPSKVRDLLTNKLTKRFILRPTGGRSTSPLRTWWIICARPEWTNWGC